MTRQDELFSLDVLCDLLKVSKSYIYKLTSKNMIPCYKVGGLKFKLSEVQKWLEKNKMKTYVPKSVDHLLK